MKAPGVKLIRRKVNNKGRRAVAYWVLRWPGSDGRTRTENIGRADQITEKEAGEIRRQKVIDLGIGKAARDPVQMTLAEFLELDREAIATDVQPSTIATHVTVSNHALAVIDGNTRIDRIGWREVAGLKSWLSRTHDIDGRTMPPCSRATIRRTIVTLKAAWNRAIRRGLVVSNPFAAEKLGKVQSKQKRIFTADEVDAMVQAASNKWWAALVRLGFTTGLRLGEMLSLTWDDIDEKNRQVIVSAKRAGPDRLEWSAKSHHERRVPLHPDAANAVQPLWQQGGGVFIESPYVFIDRDRLEGLLAKQKAGKLPQPSHWINNLPRDFKLLQAAARKRLAENRKVHERTVEWRQGTIHDLRRSYGTHIAAHVPMHELRKLMGHASITTTADFYLDVTSDLAAKVEAAFSRSA